MQKNTERRQLNNEGFSLIELLIAIVILSIIVVPLLHSFVTSARTNAKSRNTMHATAIAEDVMEQFEAHTLEEMADTYETATPTDFTNNVQRDVSLDVDGDGAAEDGIWQYTFRDEKTTSGYPELNEKDIVNIQNLAGNLNAVYSESEDAAQEAYGYFEAYSGGRDVMEIARNTTKTIEISIDSSRILLDLGDGESVAGDGLHSLSLQFRHPYGHQRRLPPERYGLCDLFQRRGGKSQSGGT